MRRCALVVSAWGLRDSLNPKIPFPRSFTHPLVISHRGTLAGVHPSKIICPSPLRLWPVVAARRRRWPRRWSRTLRDTRSERA
jgi:hypothetical protein